MTDVAVAEEGVVPYEEQARAIAEILFPVINDHKTPAEAGVIPEIQKVLTADPMLMVGLVNKTLFASPDESPEESAAKAAQISELESRREAIKKELEKVNDDLKTLSSGETPKQNATREFLQVGLNSFLNPTRYLSSTLPYEKFEMAKPEPPIKTGRPAKEKTEKVDGSSDFVHTSKHAE